MDFLSKLFGADRDRSERPASPAAVALPAPSFAARLHGQLSQHSGNLFYSPASIRVALAMAAAGAHGETAQQMQDVLGLAPDAPKAFRILRNSWKQLDGSKAVQGTQLHVANRLWTAEGGVFQAPFLQILKEDYDAPLEPLDFARQSEPSRARINQWVAQATENKVKDLVPPGVLTADTQLVLTNAVYFKAAWREPFPLERTQPGPFQIDTGPVDVPLMGKTGRFMLAQTAECQVLELPYADGRMAMDIILPRSPTDFVRVEKTFIDGALPSWLQALQSQRVEVTLPRFRIEATGGLSAPLQALGMEDAFTLGKADFSGIDGTHLLFISQVLHKAFVDVDEEGTEAAAATAVVALVGSAPGPQDPPIPFRADHPFLFVIRERSSEEILFVGRIVDPRA